MIHYLVMFGIGWFYIFYNNYPKQTVTANNVADIQFKLLLKTGPNGW